MTSQTLVNIGTANATVKLFIGIIFTLVFSCVGAVYINTARSEKNKSSRTNEYLIASALITCGTLFLFFSVYIYNLTMNNSDYAALEGAQVIGHASADVGVGIGNGIIGLMSAFHR
jgi:multisubunit Na+/H+ antiporter MnhB subunit